MWRLELGLRGFALDTDSPRQPSQLGLRPLSPPPIGRRHLLILGARPRIDLSHYWARVRSAAPRAVWPRCPGRPRASSNGKLQAPESAFESRHLRPSPSWSAPPCGPSATDIITRFVRGKPKRRARHVPGSRGSLPGRNSWWGLPTWHRLSTTLLPPTLLSTGHGCVQSNPGDSKIRLSNIIDQPHRASMASTATLTAPACTVCTPSPRPT